MTALAQLLTDAGKVVTGTDVRQHFVTKPILAKLELQIDHDFSRLLPVGTQVVVYTAAHGGPANPMVVKAQEVGLLVLSHAEALAEFFNQKTGIAVCGVGGKSTTSAMISYIFEHTRPQSFAVGVGDIGGLGKTGQWLAGSDYMVAEADEYVIDPSAPARGEEIVPRFSFLRPSLIVCTNLGFDHPDVYRDFDQTKTVYGQFFGNLRAGGKLVVNADDEDLVELAKKTDRQLLTFGENERADLLLLSYQAVRGKTYSKFKFQDREYDLTLLVPGVYNVRNALAALLISHWAGINLEVAIAALAGFTSTRRRFEFLGEKRGVKYYDDYAHHPEEIAAVIKALNEWYPEANKIIAFQSHTFSRTKELFEEFAESFRDASRVVMIDIFASAREKFDPAVSSDLLCAEINQRYPQLQAKNLKSIANLAVYFRQLPAGSVVLTIGAGDIYEVHDLVQ